MRVPRVKDFVHWTQIWGQPVDIWVMVEEIENRSARGTIIMSGQASTDGRRVVYWEPGKSLACTVPKPMDRSQCEYDFVRHEDAPDEVFAEIAKLILLGEIE